MNRLLAKKKTREAGLGDETSPPETPTAVPSAALPKKKGWRRRKGKQIEPEPEINIATALPSIDQFRTSLIMPNLSTRFSMLKEQDDPFSLLGKASDDSVLATKRRSRLGDFGHSSPVLSDIAEVASLSSSANVRAPPLVQRNGSYTYGEGYTNDDDSSLVGSIMSRARPGEGNVLFGGRQKIYRIPIGDAGSVSNLGVSESRGMRGRALYEDDVSMSAFQRLREEEKERQRLEKEMELDDPDSPALSYNEKRETVSSTNSGPSMTGNSTAPTSVAASSPGLPATTMAQPTYAPAMERSKSRKLYEQGLDQHMQEQQSANITRLSSVKRNTSLSSSTNSPYRSRSASNIHDRFEAGASSSVGTASPLPISENLTSSNSSQHRPSLEQTGSKPGSSGHDGVDVDKRNALWQAMDPSDRGMATALGTFNRPKKFSEEQFLQRQMSLLQQQPRKTSEAGSTKSVPSPTDTARNPVDNRSRSNTARTDRSWSESSVRGEETAFTNSRSVAAKEPVFKESRGRYDPEAVSNGTFFSGDVAGDDSDDSAGTSPASQHSSEQQVSQSASSNPPSARSEPPPIFTHPAMRSSPSPEPQRNREKRRAWSPDELQSGLAAQGGPHQEYLALQGQPPSAPTSELSPSAREGQTFHGLVREHLRQTSNSSSIYPLRTPGPDQTEFDVGLPITYDIPSPWDTDEVEGANVTERTVEVHSVEEEKGEDSPLTSGSSTVENDSTAPQAEPAQTPEGQELEHKEVVPDWEQELNKQHARGESTETAYERQAFASELADRQRTIQQNLKVKSEKRSASPASAAAKNVFESSLKQFGMLRPRPSGDNIQITDHEIRRPPVASNDRGYPRSRGLREGGRTPPIMGRTLHSRMPRAGDDSMQYPLTEYARQPRPSAEFQRPPYEASRVRGGSNPPVYGRNPPSRPSPSRSPRTSSPKPRANSEASGNHPSPRSARGRNEAMARPSLDSSRTRQDREKGSSSVSTPSPDRRKPHPRPNNLRQISTGSPRMSPAMSPEDTTSSAAYSAASTPPLSASSTTNVGSSATSASVSTNTQASAGESEPEVPQTGFFFPAANAAPAHVTTNSKPGSREASSSRLSPRKNTISKGDISEPTLINSTSAVDTIELPAGASLQNGLRDDFDVVLMGGSSMAPAPAPTIPTGDKPRKGGFLSNFGRRDHIDRDKIIYSGEEEPEPRRFRIRRLEAEERHGGGKPMHRAYQHADNGNLDNMF